MSLTRVAIMLTFIGVGSGFLVFASVAMFGQYDAAESLFDAAWYTALIGVILGFATGVKERFAKKNDD